MVTLIIHDNCYSTNKCHSTNKLVSKSIRNVCLAISYPNYVLHDGIAMFTVA